MRDRKKKEKQEKRKKGAGDAGARERPVETPWARPAEEVLEELEVARQEGLSAGEVTERRARWGENRLQESRRRTALAILAAQFKSLIVALLAVAGGVALAFGETVEGIAIAAVLGINALVGFLAELQAVRSMEALRQLGSVSARVRREGEEQILTAEELVAGDVVLVEEGDVITADLRLVEANNLEADESSLTGESVPMPKAVAAVAAETVVAERTSMLHKGTAVTRGSGEGVVVATGMATEVGEIAHLTSTAKEEATPLEERLERLGRRLIWLTLVIAAATTVTGILGGRGVFLMIETGIALAVAAVPEGLPIVATLALARGMWRMARRNALVNRLSAVETLGATTLIFTDKTGTLTENRMTVRWLRLPGAEEGEDGAGLDLEVEGEGLELDGAFRAQGEPLDPAEHPLLRRLLEAAVLCNNAALSQGDEEAEGGGSSGDRAGVAGEPEGMGDPLEVALLVAGIKAGIERSRLLEEAPEVREVAFDRETKMMATFHQPGGEGSDHPLRVAVKGAAEAVLAACSRVATGGGARANGDGGEPLDDGDRERWLERNRRMAEEGLRVIAVADKQAGSAAAEPYRELTFLGLVGLLDPPREDVRAAIEGCHQAGIRVVMVTGDQPATARNIAVAVGLAEEGDRVVAGRELRPVEELSADERRRLLATPVFARVDPAQKLDLIALHQADGAVVAMTGDGVNDAPALKKADIGVAMGRRGTQVAREAADMVLEDDAFTTIVAAVRQGRIIFENIRRFVLYLLSCNVSEILIVGGATAIGAPLPILPLQILFLNLVTDVFPALALGFGEGEEGIMDEPPRDPDEPIVTRRHWLAIGGYGLLITGAVLAALYGALRGLGFRGNQATTVSFLTLALAQLWHVFNMRSRRSTLVRNQITGNPWVWGALALCTLLLLAAVYLPGLSTVLQLVDPGVRGWGLALGLSLVPWAVGQAGKGVGRLPSASQ